MSDSPRPVVEHVEIALPSGASPDQPVPRSLAWRSRVTVGLTHLELAGSAVPASTEDGASWIPSPEGCTAKAREGRAGASRPLSTEQLDRVIHELLTGDSLLAAINASAQLEGLPATGSESEWRAACESWRAQNG